MNFESRNPATGELLAVYPEHDEVEINTRLQRAWDGWRHWSRTPLKGKRRTIPPVQAEGSVLNWKYGEPSTERKKATDSRGSSANPGRVSQQWYEPGGVL